MNREKNLLKNTLIITVGRVCTQLVTFLLLPLYTGILTTEEYGVVDLLNTLVSLLLPIVTFQIEQAVFREMIEVRNNDDAEKGKIITSGILFVGFQCLLYVLFFLIISPFIHNEYKIFLVTNVIAYIFSSLFLQISRGFGDNNKYAIASFISAFSTIVFNILLLVVISLRASGMLIGTFLGQLLCIVFLFIFLKLYKYIKLSYFDKNVLKKLLKYSIPLVPNAISWWVFNTSDRVIVSAMLGLSANGLLSAASKFSVVYITFYNIFNMSWTESISLHIHDIDIKDYFNKTMNIVLKIFVSMAVLMIAFMPFVYRIMINKKFIGGYNLIPILTVASLFNVIVGLISVIYIANKNTKAVANTSIISAVLNIMVHIILIRVVGLYAAAISTFVSFFAMSIFRIYDINKRYFKIIIEKRNVIVSLIMLLFVTVSYYVNNLYLNVFTIIISLIYSVLSNKSSIHYILKFFKLKKQIIK